MIRGIIKVERCESESLKNRALQAVYRLVEATDAERGLHIISYQLGTAIKMKALAFID